ncbi:MAG: AI-2E family transporter [Chitinophagaceae bacterium]
MGNLKEDNLYKHLAKAIFLAAAVIILLWLFYKMVSVILLLLFAIVLALAINGPVVKLEKMKIKRVWASAIVFSLIFLAFLSIALLVGPKINDQVSLLVQNLPDYAILVSDKISSWFHEYPEVQKQVRINQDTISNWIPSIPNTLIQVGNFSLSILAQVLIVIVFISMVAYMVSSPRPLFELYLSIFLPAQRDKATIAFSRVSTMVRGWMKSNLIGGLINAVLSTIFLSIMNVPGAFVWGALAFFTEFIPRIGFFIKALPPILVALSINGYTAIWVSVFYLATDEIMADFVMPRVRSNTMKIHPVSILFVVLAMGSAFGFIGVLLATPLTAIIKAYFEVFYVNNSDDGQLMDKRINAMMYSDDTT